MHELIKYTNVNNKQAKPCSRVTVSAWKYDRPSFNFVCL